MKKSIIFVMAALLLTAAYAYAEVDIPIQNEQLTLSDTTVNLKFDLAGPAAGREVKILYGDLSASKGAEGFDENTTIQPYTFWFQQVETGKTSVAEMVSQGWDLRQIFWVNSSQAYFYFIK
jgi:hypothetical protein